MVGSWGGIHMKPNSERLTISRACRYQARGSQLNMHDNPPQALFNCIKHVSCPVHCPPPFPSPTSAEHKLLVIGPTEPWSVREKLCLATSVMKSGDQNWYWFQWFFVMCINVLCHRLMTVMSSLSHLQFEHAWVYDSSLYLRLSFKIRYDQWGFFCCWNCCPYMCFRALMLWFAFFVKRHANKLN